MNDTTVIRRGCQRWLRSLLPITLVAGGTGCSLLLGNGSDAVQCKTNADCEGLAPGYICAAGGVCQAPPPADNNKPIVTPQTTPSTCSTDDECITANGGRAARCPTPGGQCLNLANEYCEVRGEFKNRNAIFIGDFRTDDTTSAGLSYESRIFGYMLDYAFDESLTLLPAGGLPLGVNGAHRPLVKITCDGGNLEPDRVAAIAQHLVKELGVPAVFTHASRKAMDFWAAAVATQAPGATEPPVFLMSAVLGNLRSLLTGTGDTSTVFNYEVPTDRSVRPNSLQFNQAFEPAIRATPGFDGPDVRGVTVVSGSYWTPEYPPMVDKIGTGWQYNGGKTALSQVGTNYNVISYADKNSPHYGEAAAAIAAYRPHAIFVAGETDFERIVLPLVEGLWPAGQMRPYYNGSDTQTTGPMADAVGQNEGLRQRVTTAFPYNYGYDTDKYNSIAGRFVQSFPGVDPVSEAYDAYYWLLYAIVAAGDVPNGQPKPTDILRGAKKLQDGPQAFQADGAQLLSGFAALINDGAVKLTGSNSDMKFDFTSGEISNDGSLFICVMRGPGGVPTMSYLTNNPPPSVYDTASDALLMPYDCP